MPKETKVLHGTELFWANFTLYQDPEGFCFSFDAVILACFCHTSPEKNMLDVGTGNGILPLLLLAKEPTLEITAIEIQEESAQLAQYNMAQNGVNVNIIAGDFMEAPKFFAKSQFESIISNPPYFKKDTGRLSPRTSRNIAKVEIHWDSPTFFKHCYDLLKEQATLTLAYPAHRNEEINAVAKTQGLHLSRRLWLRATATKAPYLVLQEWQKTTEPPATLWEETLTIYTPEGNYTPEINRCLKEKAWPK